MNAGLPQTSAAFCEELPNIEHEMPQFACGYTEEYSWESNAAGGTPTLPLPLVVHTPAEEVTGRSRK